MSDLLYTLPIHDLSHPTCRSTDPITHIETGKVVYLPNLSFTVDNPELLHPSVVDAKKKNVSYDYQSKRLRGVAENSLYHRELHSMMHAYADYAQQLIIGLFPEYHSALRWGRTSYRPVEILGRQRSKRQDDTRVHVDAFPATPVQGWRILRVFCNVNPNHQPRVWNLGDNFNTVLTNFGPQLPTYKPWKAAVLQYLRITKTLRSAYDHYMLHLHDQMKLDDYYQAQVKKTRIDFAAQSTWIVFTDQVSHAALSGQYALEQTFYLPISAMANPDLSPFKQIEHYGLQVA
jgi:hypothetical protein